MWLVALFRHKIFLVLLASQFVIKLQGFLSLHSQPATILAISNKMV